MVTEWWMDYEQYPGPSEPPEPAIEPITVITDWRMAGASYEVNQVTHTVHKKPGVIRYEVIVDFDEWMAVAPTTMWGGLGRKIPGGFIRGVPTDTTHIEPPQFDAQTNQLYMNLEGESFVA